MRPWLLISMLVLPLGGWGIYWWQAAGAAKSQIALSVEYVNGQFKTAGSGTQLSYESMEAANYFGRPEIIIQKPAVTVTGGMSSARIEADSLRLSVDGEGEWQLHLPPVFRAIQGSRWGGEYSVAVSPVPEVWLRNSVAQKAQPSNSGPLGQLLPAVPLAPEGWPAEAIHQFAYKLPATLSLTSTKAGKGNTAQFNLPSVPLRMWQPIPLQPDGSVDFLLALLGEISEAPSPPKP